MVSRVVCVSLPKRELKTQVGLAIFQTNSEDFVRARWKELWCFVWVEKYFWSYTRDLSTSLELDGCLLILEVPYCFA